MIEVMQATSVSWDGLLVAGSVMIATVGAVWKYSVMFNRLLTRMQQTEDRIMALEDDAFGLAKMCELALRTALNNPDMNIPDPRNPSKIICVQQREKREPGPVTP